MRTVSSCPGAGIIGSEHTQQRGAYFLSTNDEIRPTDSNVGSLRAAGLLEVSLKMFLLLLGRLLQL